jgi:hypothetical protein
MDISYLFVCFLAVYLSAVFLCIIAALFRVTVPHSCIVLQAVPHEK